MDRKRTTILVSVDLDPVPGWGNDPMDYVKHIQRVLNETIGHYNPEVRIAEYQADFTSQVVPEMISVPEDS